MGLEWGDYAWVRGWFHVRAVSPDGCEIVVAVSPRHEARVSHATSHGRRDSGDGHSRPRTV